MNWGVVEWSAIIGIFFTIISAGLASYIGVIRSNISTKKDIDNGFEKLRVIELETSKTLSELEKRLNNKSIRLDTLEKMLFKYLEKAEAEAIYCKKEIMEPQVNNIIKNQEQLFKDLKEFSKSVTKSLENISTSFNKHIEDDRVFQQNLLNKLSEGQK